jgi:hypothetical protein
VSALPLTATASQRCTKPEIVAPNERGREFP